MSATWRKKAEYSLFFPRSQLHTLSYFRKLEVWFFYLLFSTISLYVFGQVNQPLYVFF